MKNFSSSPVGSSPLFSLPGAYKQGSIPKLRLAGPSGRPRPGTGKYDELKKIVLFKSLGISVRTLELDVVVTKDSQLVISHEPWMNAAFCSHQDGRPVLKAEEDSLIILYSQDAGGGSAI